MEEALVVGTSSNTQTQLSVSFARAADHAFCKDAKYLTNVNPTGSANAISLSISPNGAFLAKARAQSPYLQVYNTTTWTTVTLGTTPGSAQYQCAFSPDGTKLAVAQNNAPGLVVFNTSDWSVVSLGESTNYCYGLAWSGDSSRLAVAHSASPYVKVYETTGWTVVATPSGPGSSYSLAYSPDGTKLAVGGTVSPYLRVFNTSDWSDLSAPTQVYYPMALAFSPDGTKLALGNQNSPYSKVLNVSGWTTVTLTPAVTAGSVRKIAFNASGSRLACAHDGSPFITVYETTGWTPITMTPTVPTNGGGVAYGQLPLTAVKNPSNPILDDLGNPAVRTVRVFDRLTGELFSQVVSDASGLYHVPLVTTRVVDVQFMDDDGGTQYNDIIKARVTPA